MYKPKPSESGTIKYAPKITLDHAEKTEKNIGEVIDGLIHDVENDLQVISMEAHVQPRSKREPRCALAAVANIEKLLGEYARVFASSMKLDNQLFASQNMSTTHWAQLPGKSSNASGEAT
jgi:hypothetical protein